MMRRRQVNQNRSCRRLPPLALLAVAVKEEL
jgi:hypothetical protein